MIKLVAVRNELETGANLLLGSRLLTNRAGIRGSYNLVQNEKEQLTPSPPKEIMKWGDG